MTVEWLGTKDIRIDRLKLDGDWRARLKQPAVEQRAKSIQKLGLIQQPVVRKSDMRLIAGRDRVAAHVHLGLDFVPCRLCECSDAEAVEIAAAENIERRHLDQRQLEAAIAKTVEELTDAIALTTGKKRAGSGPKGSAQAEAERRVAEVIGVKPEAIARQRQRRQRRPTEETPVPEPETTPIPPPIETFGLTLDEEWLDQVREHQLVLEGVLDRLTQIATAIGQLSRSPLPHHTSRLQLLTQELQTFREVVRGSFPTHLCPWCKGQKQALQQCAACSKTAVVLRHQLAWCPRELLDKDKLAISLHGSLVPIQVAAPEDDIEGW